MPSPAPSAEPGSTVAAPEVDARPGPLPPWLWIWAATLVCLTPEIAAATVRRAYGFFEASWIHHEVMTPIAVTYAAVTLFELLPILVLLAGIVLALAPGQRARRVQRRYGLKPADTATGALSEIRALIDRHAPELALHANLRRMAPLAFIYPLGYRRSAIAVCGGLVKTWRSDRPAAEAVLLHEIAHYRQGDPMIVGVGSFLTPALRWWPMLIVLFLATLVTLDLVFAGPIERFADARRQVTGTTDPDAMRSLWEMAFFYLHEFSPLAHPTMIGTVGQLTLWFLAIVIIPVIGLWCAELTADRYTAAEPASRAALIRALERRPPRPPLRPAVLWGWLFRLISHPPTRLRLALARAWNRPATLLPLLALFPASYAVGILLVLAMTHQNAVARGTTDVGLIAFVAELFVVLMGGIRLQIGVLGAVLLLWPLLAGWWLLLVTGRSGGHARRGAPVLVAFGAALLAVALLLPSADPTRAGLAEIESIRPPPVEDGPSIRVVKPVFAVGERIVVRVERLPATLENWVTIVPLGTAEEMYLDYPGYWAYTAGIESGEMTFTPQLPGLYEARLYLDWPDGGTTIRSYDRFQVLYR